MTFFHFFGRLHEGRRLSARSGDPAPGSRPSQAARMGGAQQRSPARERRRIKPSIRTGGDLGTGHRASLSVHCLPFCLFFGRLHEGRRLSARSGGPAPGSRPSQAARMGGAQQGCLARERRARHSKKPSQRNSMSKNGVPVTATRNYVSTNGGLAECGVQNRGSN